jgi:hypothetical protein
MEKISYGDKDILRYVWLDLKEKLPGKTIQQLESKDGVLNYNNLREWLEYYEKAAGNPLLQKPNQYVSRLEALLRIFSDPRNKETYIFKDEASYYQDYQYSKFAVTTQKAGWDCMRHYEIMGNGCIPLFPDIAHCPRFIMMKFPKALVTRVAFFEKTDSKWLDKNYEYLQAEMQDHFLKYNTTLRLGEQFMKELKNIKTL